jgi:hypothetical protein
MKLVQRQLVKVDFNLKSNLAAEEQAITTMFSSITSSSSNSVFVNIAALYPALYFYISVLTVTIDLTKC